MSDPTVTDTASTQDTAPAQDATQTPAQTQQTSDLLSQASTESIFDPIYQEGVLDNLPESSQGIRKWLEMQKNGAGLEKGIVELQKYASQKGLEVPPPDAPEEVLQTFNETRRKFNRVPEKPEDYEFKMPEGFEDNLTPEYKKALSEWAHERGVGPDTINEFLPFQAEMEVQAREEHVKAELEHLNTYFRDQGIDLKAEEPELRKFIEKQGMDLNRPAFSNAETWILAHRLKGLLGEDKHVAGQPIQTGISAGDIQGQIDKLRESGNLGSSDAQVRIAANKQWIDLHKQLVAAQRK